MKNLKNKKFHLFNKTLAKLMADSNASLYHKNITIEFMKLLEADFGFALAKLGYGESFELAYKSADIKFDPLTIEPKNNVGVKTSNLFYDENVKKNNYKSDISKYFKSYITIVVSYGNHHYGNLFLGYKKQRKFSEEDLMLAEALGNSLAFVLTINWQIENEQKSLLIAEKQKETDILLSQEKLKTEFIANATHELRTPLAIMKGNVDLALMPKADAKTMKHALKEVNSEIKILADILKDLALITSSGNELRNVIKSSPVNLSEVVVKVVHRVKTISSEKGIKISFKKPSTYLSVKGDAGYLEKLFLNLLTNAITYGKKDGKVDVKISKQDNYVKIDVVDNGIGIAEEDLPKIFERFFRADKAHSAHGTHSGLGLAIGKWVAELHGGKLTATSTYGKGSTFTVLLPLS